MSRTKILSIFDELNRSFRQNLLSVRANAALEAGDSSRYTYSVVKQQLMDRVYALASLRRITVIDGIHAGNDTANTASRLIQAAAQCHTKKDFVALLNQTIYRSFLVSILPLNNESETFQFEEIRDALFCLDQNVNNAVRAKL